MARITVEDCLKKIDSQYDLVLLAKERTSQLNAGTQSLVPIDNDKNTVISLREIAEGKISIKSLEESGINRLRIQKEDAVESGDIEDEQDDDFDKIYKGEVSKSGAAILPSKRVRRIPEKISLKQNLDKDELEKDLETEDESTDKEEVAKENEPK
tara:strand:+ start:299 stop:763 length:465 start_codon:yes stop_codon:yes gene_type:complete